MYVGWRCLLGQLSIVGFWGDMGWLDGEHRWTRLATWRTLRDWLGEITKLMRRFPETKIVEILEFLEGLLVAPWESDPDLGGRPPGATRP
jgi:hypothetical protein